MGTRKVMVSFPEEFLAEIDRAAREEQRSRSEFLRTAAREYLQIHKACQRPIADAVVQRAIATQEIIAERLKTGETTNSTAELRQWRGALK